MAMSPMPGGISPPEEALAPATRRFRFPLPLDPVRLLAGALSRWPWILAAVILFSVAGIFAGIQLTQPTYAISVSLIKRRVPQTVQTSETGQAFRPVDLNDATLLATLLASEPLDLAVRRAKNGMDAGSFRKLTEATQLEGTDIFYITYHSPIGIDDALSFSAIWAEEINSYTQRLQQTEAREVRSILQKEVEDLRSEIDQTNAEILGFSKAKEFLGGESQVAAVLAKLSQIEIQLETAKTTAAAKAEQLKALDKQIRRQSPIELQLKTAREELANLRSTYTDANPLVQAKLQSIQYLEAQIEELGTRKDADLEAYTGTPLGNQLYLSIITLKNELMEASSTVESLERLRESTAERLAEFPGIISGYEALQKKRDSVIEGLTLMSNRLKEAEIFASGAPGYWQVFQAPDPRSVIPSSRVKKPAMLGAAMGLLGGGLAVALTVLFTHRSSRRSILECCAATKAPLLASIPTSYEEDARAAIQHLWITQLAPRFSKPGRMLFWTPALSPEEERKFWGNLSECVLDDTKQPLQVHDCSPDNLWNDENPRPPSLVWSSSIDIHPSSVPRVFRASSLPSGPARESLGSISEWFTIVAGQKDSLTKAAQSRDLAEAYLPSCNGTIALMERPQGIVRRAADVLSFQLAKKFS